MASKRTGDNAMTSMVPVTKKTKCEIVAYASQHKKVSFCLDYLNNFQFG